MKTKKKLKMYHLENLPPAEQIVIKDLAEFYLKERVGSELKVCCLLPAGITNQSIALETLVKKQLVILGSEDGMVTAELSQTGMDMMFAKWPKPGRLADR